MILFLKIRKTIHFIKKVMMMYDVFKFNYYNLIQYGATMFDTND